MICSMTGEPCQEPVVTPSGHVYEKRILENALASNGGKDPKTDEPLEMRNVIQLQVESTVRPRPLTATSIPGMCLLFQNEWDALMLETFNLKKQLEQVRQELAQAFYQQDASCRVIARLLKERDEARAALASARLAGPEVAMVDAGPTEITREIQLALVKQSKSLTAKRKKREVSASLAKADDISQYAELSSNPVHKASEPGILCLDIHPSNPERIVTGGVDKVAVLFNRKSGKKIGALTGHSKKITSVLFHPTQEVVLTASADKTARVWTGSNAGYDTTHRIRTHTAEVSSLALHCSGDYFATASQDETWGFHDLRSGNTLLHVQHAKNTALNAIQFHPDGLLVATGATDALVRLWDVKEKGKNVATFSGHSGKVNSIAFSENGIYMATCSEDNTVKMWDLRKLKDFQTYTFPTGNAPQSVSFDFSGVYLAAGADSVRVFIAKTLEEVANLSGHSGLVTGVKFGPDATWLASTSMDRSLKFWGKS